MLFTVIIFIQGTQAVLDGFQNSVEKCEPVIPHFGDHHHIGQCSSTTTMHQNHPGALENVLV